MKEIKARNLIIGVTGKAGSGKDEFFKAINAVNADGVRRFAFADNLKDRICRMLEVTREDIERDKPHYRPFMQWLGTDHYRGRDVNFWVKVLANLVENDHADTPIIVTDVRFQNEADYIRSVGGIVIRIRRVAAGAGTHAGHASETELDGIVADIVIENEGTLEELHAKARETFEQLLLPK